MSSNSGVAQDYLISNTTDLQDHWIVMEPNPILCSLITIRHISKCGFGAQISLSLCLKLWRYTLDIFVPPPLPRLHPRDDNRSGAQWISPCTLNFTQRGLTVVVSSIQRIELLPPKSLSHSWLCHFYLSLSVVPANIRICRIRVVMVVIHGCCDCFQFDGGVALLILFSDSSPSVTLRHLVPLCPVGDSTNFRNLLCIFTVGLTTRPSSQSLMSSIATKFPWLTPRKGNLL